MSVSVNIMGVASFFVNNLKPILRLVRGRGHGFVPYDALIGS